jgi:hypothetical protein
MIAFRRVFETMFELRKDQRSNAKHLNQWCTKMGTNVAPRIGDKLVSEVTAADHYRDPAVDLLQAGANRQCMPQRIETAFKSAVLHGQREKVSPCYGIREQSRRVPADDVAPALG